MPNETVPTPEYDDDGVTVAVEPPTGSRPTIRFLARGEAVAVRVDLSASGATALAGMLVATAAAAVAQLDADGPS